MEWTTLINSHQNKLHHLAQFLSAFGSSYLPKQEDHSETNLGWDIAKSSLVSRTFKDIQIELEYPGVMLFIIHKGKKHAYDPLGATLNDTDRWIRESLSELGLDPGKYSREMGFTITTPEDVFISLDNDDEKILLQLTEERNIAQKALLTIQEEFAMPSSEIRIWPHHFDTGMLAYPDKGNSGKGFSLGYAPADDLSPVPYYYASAWSELEIDYQNLPELSVGKWESGRWKGAITGVDDHIDLNVITNFYREFIAAIANSI